MLLFLKPIALHREHEAIQSKPLNSHHISVDEVLTERWEIFYLKNSAITLVQTSLEK